ncbi:MAG: efflux RND transporter permease subunit [bacterium]|nr:efflux RND transporter permease subunit [bacterium]
MRLVDVSIRRPVTVFISAVAAVVFGIVAFGELATDLLPDITYPSLTIRTTYDGAAPVEVESLVTRPIENAVGVVQNLVRISSSSRPEVSEVTLEFAWDTAMDFAALDVRERLDQLRLPLESEPPVLLRYDPSFDPILRIGVSGTAGGQSDGDDLVRLRRVAEERIQRPLERIEGVAAALVEGGLEEELQVLLDERQLANLGLGVDTVINRLSQENVNVTGGRLRDGQTEYMVRTVGELLRPEQLREVVIDAGRGAIVRLDDVAEVRRGFREREIITRIDGRESVEVAIYKAGGTNTVKVSDAVREGLEAVRAQLGRVDPGLEVVVITDQARYIRRSVSEVLQTALLGGLLAVVVLFLFLRSWKATLIIAGAIPISVVATFFLMYLSDISLNIMSLGGLTLGIGLLVDNAIVVLESIQRRRDGGLDEVEAARTGAGQVATAIVASTLTSICVFLPIVFVEGVAAQFFADQALTVTYSLLISLLVALTVIPMLASRGFRTEAEEAGGGNEPASRGLRRRLSDAIFRSIVAIGKALKTTVLLITRPLAVLVALPARAFGAVFERVAVTYDRVLDGALRRPLITVAIALALFGGSLALYPRLGSELVPELIQGEFFLDAELPPGTHLDVTQRRLARIEATALGLDGVGTVYALIGASSQQGGIAGENRENLAQVTLTVAPPFSREREERLMAEMRDSLNGEASAEQMEVRFGRPSYFSFKTPIEVEIRGYNLRLLRRLADRLVAGMRGLDGLTDVESSAEGGTPELQVRFDRERLATLGLSVQEVASVVQSKILGTVATEIQREDRTIDIRVRSDERFRSSARDLENLVVYQQGKTALPLSAVAEVTEGEGPAEIRRADGERVAVISANLDGRDLASASAAITGLVEELDLPAGFDWRMGGQQQEMETSFDSMRLALYLAIFLVYLVMASQFESLLHPFVILFSVPLSLIGVLATLYLFDVRISIVVLIGVVLLAGIVVNNAIILVDTANRLRREGLAKLDALRRAGRTRLRPILMTTATTVLGLTPMAIGLGEGSELRAPMALAVIGGLLSSTALTLVVIPVMYRLLDRGK